jgi:hypothetical protein
MPRAMKTPAGLAAAFLLFLSACSAPKRDSGSEAAEAIFKAPKASTGSGIDPDAQGVTGAVDTEVKSSRPALQEAPTGGLQFKEIDVDPKDVRTRVDLTRTLLGQEWMFVSKTLKTGGVYTWKFVRRDVGKVDDDPFGIPDIYKAKEKPIETPK